MLWKGLTQRGKNRLREHRNLIEQERRDGDVLFLCGDPGCNWMGWLTLGVEVEEIPDGNHMPGPLDRHYPIDVD